jgi:hypothetical protein
MKRAFLLLMILTTFGACGSGNGESREAPEPGRSSNDQQEETDDQDETTESSFKFEPGARLGGSATFNVEGTVLTYSMDEIEYSPNQAISDVTFEECSPNFFGFGVFRAIGYPVDGNGELLLRDNGDIAGALEMYVPPDDWEARGLDDGDVEMRLNSEAAGIDFQNASPETAAQIAPDAAYSWSFTDNGVSGSVVMKNSRSEPFVVEFDAVCE